MGLSLPATAALLVLALSSCGGPTSPNPRPTPPLPPFTRSCASDAPELFVFAPTPAAPIKPDPSPRLVRRGYVYVTRELLTRPQERGTMIRLNLYADLCLDAFFDRRVPGVPPGEFDWRGGIVGERFATAAFGGETAPNGALSGDIGGMLAAGNRGHQVSCTERVICVVDEIDGRGTSATSGANARAGPGGLP